MFCRKVTFEVSCGATEACEPHINRASGDLSGSHYRGVQLLTLSFCNDWELFSHLAHVMMHRIISRSKVYNQEGFKHLLLSTYCF